jgi:hypothetical protein
MIEFVVKGEEFGDLAALGISYGLSITFRRVLAVGDFEREWIYAVMETGVWGAMLLSPCPDGLPCFRDPERAVEFSESRQTPVGYSGEEPAAVPYRISTFNKNYLKPRRWIRCRDISSDKSYLPLFACIYNLLKLRDDVPIVVSDVCLGFNEAERPDFQALPTYIQPRALADVVDVSVQPNTGIRNSEGDSAGRLQGGSCRGPYLRAPTMRRPSWEAIWSTSTRRAIPASCSPEVPWGTPHLYSLAGIWWTQISAIDAATVSSPTAMP